MNRKIDKAQNSFFERLVKLVSPKRINQETEC